MPRTYKIAPEPQRAFLVGVTFRDPAYHNGARLPLEASLEELALLCKTAGLEVVGQTTQTLDAPHPKTFIGPGKVEELKAWQRALDFDVLVFDDELSPRHQRELEEAFNNDNIVILDRTALILDIFAQHARTREGALQVELAQYEYRKPRLTRQWTHLARQAGGTAGRSGTGGVGLRGPGETQLEIDRRRIDERIARLKQALEEVRKQRAQHRAQRRRAEIPVIAIVGYTNAGKSTLLNAIAHANVLAEDKLFATLDPTTRRVRLPRPSARILRMGSPAIAASEPDVVIGPDGLPRLSQAYLDAYERFMQTLVTEDDTPVDNLFSAKQARLLIDRSTPPGKHPRFGRRFIADGNVGVFYAFHQPPVVPDMFLSLDVTPPADLWKKTSRSYFIWEYGKPPEVVVEIVSNTEGGEEEPDGKLGIYGRIKVARYVVYDPGQQTGGEPLRVYALQLAGWCARMRRGSTTSAWA
jgi:GTP-binding protein HflX